MNILFLVNSFKRGGAERVIINLLNYLPGLDPDLKLFLYFLEDAVNPYPVPDHVHLMKRKKRPKFQSTKFFNIPVQASRLKTFTQENEIDLVLSFLSRSNYVNMIAKWLGSHHQVIMSERNTPSFVYSSSGIKDRINGLLIRKLYPHSFKIIAISQGVKNDLVNSYDISSDNIVVIYNPIDTDVVMIKSKEKVDHKWLTDKSIKTIISVGRLEKQKNHTLLINAFKIVSKNHPNTRLMILGEGTERKNLEKLTKELNLTSKVCLIGLQDNPFAFVSKADLFVLSSDFEGFGNVIIEAMVCGCPVISTDCQSGPNEIITHKKDGYLTPVGDVDAMSDAISTLLENKSLRESIIENAYHRANDFRLEKISEQYLQTIKNN